MDQMRIDKGDWLVVCDGRKALILENRGDEMFPNLHTREARTAQSLDRCARDRRAGQAPRRGR
jgi:protein required for attachment to host cells